MSNDRRRRRAPEGEVAAIGKRTAGSDRPVLVVGVGASADGSESLQQLFANMPLGHGVAFVLIQHPDPSREDLRLAQLQANTALTVVEATDGMAVLADRIHVMPLDKFLNITGGALTLHEPVYCNGLRMPIDHFFCSLAADQRRRACGVVLSGTGSDGALGLSEIKASGGRTIVEDPGSAERPNTPKSAIDAGVVDAVLPVGAIIEAIVAFAHQVAAAARNEPVESPEFDAELLAILDIVRTKVGHDFRCYKPNTLVRRIRRRMTLAKVATYIDYGQFLQEHPDEVGVLRRDLLIGVTEFFRQPQAWEVLEEKLLAVLVKQAQPESEIRAWVPGCSTGQEAYSLAILLSEQMEKLGKQAVLQIFATDSDAASLATARSGSYSAEDLGSNVSTERRKRFFSYRDGRYQVIKEIRERIVFAPQNLMADPPFSRLDLISCRNLLIYLDQQVQQKIIALFHFALREGGFLFLGTAETVGEREDLFEPVSKKWRIYRRIGVGRRVGVEIPVCPSSDLRSTSDQPPVSACSPRLSLASAAQQMLLERFAPACVMIDRKLQVLYVHGAVENYLTFPPGELTTRVVDMAREGLRARLRGGISKCLEVNRSVSVTARVRRGGKSVPVKATVSPMRYPRETDGLLLITFEDYRVACAKLGPQSAGGSDLQQLEDELKVTREELQSTIEQLESSNDQHRASNEEVTAANEELQSANEELETSKEELQSLNEELNTINARLQEKVDELESANNDVVNLLSSTNIATVFLDKDLRVRRYTPAITRLLSLIPSDLGRPVADVLRRFSDESLLDEARRVLEDLTPESKEVPADDGRWYIRRITPYRTQDDRIEGVVITFVDITDLKRSEQALRCAKEEWEQTFNTVPDLVALLDDQHRIVRVNRAMADRLGLTPDQCIGLRCHEAIHGVRQAPAFCPHALTCRDGRQHVAEVHEPKLGGDFLVSTTPRFDQQGRLVGAVHVARDITERKKAEEALRESEEHYRSLFDNMLNGFAHCRMLFEQGRPVDFIFLDVNSAFEALTGLKDVAGKKVSEVIPGLRESDPELFEIYGRVATSGIPEHFETYVEGLGMWFSISVYSPRSEHFVAVFDVITERKEAEEAVRRSREDLNRAQAVAHTGSWRLDVRRNELLWSDENHKIFGIPKGTHMTYETFLGSVHPDDRQYVHEKWSAGLRGEHYDIEHRIVLNDTVKWVREKAELEFDQEGALLGGFGTTQDITELKRAERALRDSEARFRLLSETAGKLLATADPQGIVNELCREVMKHLDCQAFFNFLMDEQTGRLRLNACAGIPAEEIHKLAWLDLGEAVCGCVARDAERIVVESISTTLDPRTELVKSYGIEAYACHPLLAQGRLIGTLSFGTKTRTCFAPEELDLMKTVADEVAIAMDRIRLISELQESRDELEVRVQERTAELQKSNAALAQSNRDLEAFAYVASHDLQEPLRKIQTFSNRLVTLYQALLDDKARDYLERMQRAAQRMQTLVLDLLKYSRITSNPEPFTRFSLRKPVEEAAADLGVLCEETAGRIEVNEVPEVEADRVQMRQLFQNLIANGLKYHGTDKPIIKIYTRSSVSAPFWEICVEDNGIGFDEDYLDRIFKPFQRLHGRSAPYQGTGMGLAICQRIAERHGGSITAESKPGEGSIFIVRLPKEQVKLEEKH